MTTYTDYLMKFPVAGLPLALQAFAALRTAGLLGTGDIPTNMLGDARNTSGAVVDRNGGTAAWFGRPGVAAFSYTDTDTGQTVAVPARGNPANFYVHIRSTVPSSALPFNPATFGLTPSDPAESAAVLGVWE